MRRVQLLPEYTLIGGILRFETMANVVRAHLKEEVNVPPESLVQFVAALGAALLAQRRWQKLHLPNGGRRQSEGIQAHD